MKQVIAAVVGLWVRSRTQELALRNGIERSIATPISVLAGAAASALVLRI